MNAVTDLLREIIDLASWHCDHEADEADQSPRDMTAHVNGLIVRKCEQAIAELRNGEQSNEND